MRHAMRMALVSDSLTCKHAFRCHHCLSSPFTLSLSCTSDQMQTTCCGVIDVLLLLAWDGRQDPRFPGGAQDGRRPPGGGSSDADSLILGRLLPRRLPQGPPSSRRIVGCMTESRCPPAAACRLPRRSARRTGSCMVDKFCPPAAACRLPLRQHPPASPARGRFPYCCWYCCRRSCCSCAYCCCCCCCA
jgi:hypothetical protein